MHPSPIAPLLAGILFHEILPSFTKILQPVLEWFFRISVITLLLAFIVPSLEAMARFSFLSFFGIFTAITASLFAGYYAGGSNRKDRISLSVTSGLGNLAVIMLVAHVCYPQAHVLFAVLAHVIVRWAVFMFCFLLLRLSLNYFSSPKNVRS